MKAKTRKGIVNSLLVGRKTDQMQGPESSSSLGSTTHYWASIFFPLKEMYTEVSTWIPNLRY